MARNQPIVRADDLDVMEAVTHRAWAAHLADEQEAAGVTLDTDDGEVMIRLGPEREHRLGLLTLPMTSVEFDFKNHDEAQVAAFMARFDLSFRRGGG